MIEEKIKKTVRDVPDFPKEGIMFKDITPIFQNQSLCDEVTEAFVDRISGKKIDAIVGVESRGFLFGFSLANKLNIPFVLIRKAGKLPFEKISYEYKLEYGSAKMELQKGDIKPDWNVLIHDDLLATGGTAEAAVKLIEMERGKVAGFSFLIELDFLKGRESLLQYSPNIISLANY